MSDHIERVARVIAAHIGKPANGGTANGAWLDCACLAEAKGVSRDHVTRLHRKHVARALDAAGLLVTPEHDAAVKASGLRMAASALYDDDRANGKHGHPLSVASWLRELADRIERGATT